MIRKYLPKVELIVCLFILTGCVSEPGVLESNWGKAYETAKYQQILNPNADKNLTPVEGLDGKKAERILESYHKGFETNKEPPASNINLTDIVGK